MPPLAWAAVGAYLVATLVSRVPGQRERHGLRAGWWWLGMFALAVHLVVHYGRWQALGGVDLHFFAALSLVTAAMSAITLLLGVNRDSSLLAIVAFPIAALMLGLYALLGKPVPTPATQDWRITLHAAIAGDALRAAADLRQANERHAHAGQPVALVAVVAQAHRRPQPAAPGGDVDRHRPGGSTGRIHTGLGSDPADGRCTSGAGEQHHQQNRSAQIQDMRGCQKCGTESCGVLHDGLRQVVDEAPSEQSGSGCRDAGIRSIHPVNGRAVRIR